MQSAEAVPAPSPSTPSSPPTSESPLSSKGITLSPMAVTMAKAKLEKRGTPDAALRLGVRGGGCSGFNYVIEFSDDPPRDRDRVFEFDGLRVVVDKKSLVYLAGMELDWVQTLMQQGFKVNNPNEKTSCGCGHSFTV